jgi:hypothetical protein
MLVAMKLKTFWKPSAREGAELIALFGRAQLVRHLDGSCEIVGGSDEDRDAARDWISLYLHNVILRAAPTPRLVIAPEARWRRPQTPTDSFAA